MENAFMFNITYGLYVLTARDGDKDNGCIIDAAIQVTAVPNRMIIVVNKNNYTHGMIERTGVFNLSVLTMEAPLDIFKRFGFQSGENVDKFQGLDNVERAENGVLYIEQSTNAFMSGKVFEKIDLGSHTMFFADVTDGAVLSNVQSITYDYYRNNIK